ncbi:ATP-binding protein [Streptomyces sp. XM83C]|uniref:ATP-binding protein n=1 Tax=Streptomyces sp. XM83C TaxID=2929781 RepID=UPI0027E555FB|nr:ATP-binding protein [Streptomyces sp. XM83C]
MNHTAPPHSTAPHPTRPTVRPRTFTQLLSATRRGARLARLLGTGQLRAWDMPPALTERAEVVIAELAANAVLHGRVHGRCFRLTLVFEQVSGLVRVEVSDARGDVWPQIVTGADDATALRPGGRGLALVAALADEWDCVPFPPSGKTVRAVFRTAESGTAPAGATTGGRPLVGRTTADGHAETAGAAARQTR